MDELGRVPNLHGQRGAPAVLRSDDAAVEHDGPRGYVAGGVLPGAQPTADHP